MTKTLGYAMVLLAMAGFAQATTTPVPEIDGNTAMAAVALISGGLLIARSRRKR